MRLEFEDGSSIIENKAFDTFFVGFNNNIFLRESCYLCEYCGTNRISDFTIADFWGVTEERASKEQLEMGVSLMLVNSDKARNMLPELQNNLIIEKISPEEAIPFNRSLVKPNDRPAKRNVFFDDIKKHDYDGLIKKYFSKIYLKHLIKIILIKIFGDKFVDHIRNMLKKLKQGV